MGIFNTVICLIFNLGIELPVACAVKTLFILLLRNKKYNHSLGTLSGRTTANVLLTILPSYASVTIAILFCSGRTVANKMSPVFTFNRALAGRSFPFTVLTFDISP